MEKIVKDKRDRGEERERERVNEKRENAFRTKCVRWEKMNAKRQNLAWKMAQFETNHMVSWFLVDYSHRSDTYWKWWYGFIFFSPLRLSYCCCRYIIASLIPLIIFFLVVHVCVWFVACVLLLRWNLKPVAVLITSVSVQKHK